MTLGVHLSPSKLTGPHDPGHMCVHLGAEAEGELWGFVFDPSELPTEYREPSKWAAYLSQNTIPGHVRKDFLTQDRLEQHPDKVMTVRWMADVTAMRKARQRRRNGKPHRYSFNPDNHLNCHNCVTWAVSTMNEALGEVLPRVPQGRISIMSQRLQAISNPSS